MGFIFFVYFFFFFTWPNHYFGSSFFHSCKDEKRRRVVESLVQWRFTNWRKCWQTKMEGAMPLVILQHRSTTINSNLQPKIGVPHVGSDTNLTVHFQKNKKIKRCSSSPREPKPHVGSFKVTWDFLFYYSTNQKVFYTWNLLCYYSANQNSFYMPCKHSSIHF